MGAGITLWLVPSSEDIARLKNVMKLRPESHPSAKSYPNFVPHITLAKFPPDGDVPCTNLRSSVPPSQPSIPIKFQSIEVGTHFFRSVYIAVQNTPALSALHAHVHSTLGLEPRTPAFPHLSLCYIADEDAESGERDMFFQELKRGRYRARADGVGINCAEGEEGDDWLFGFEASEIWAMKCEGPAEDWVFLEAVPLHPSLDDV